MKVRLHSIQECPIGYGRRLGIWLQGCNLACPGCSSRDTWSAGPESEMPWPLFAATLEFMLQTTTLDGITISGGEPFQQKDALRELLRKIRSLQKVRGADWDIILYTGYNYDEVSDNEDILSEIDLLVAGRYDMNRPKSDLRGSDNQTMHWLTKRAKDRYSVAWLADKENTNKMKVTMLGNDIVWTGLPKQGDLARLEDLLMSQGIDWTELSWKK